MKLFFVSLGCDKNLVDSEKMIGILCKNGHEIVQTEEEAEAIIVNTCSFIRDAQEESVNAILEMSEYRKNGTCRALIVTGCMAQRYQKEIMDEVPEVDAVVGTTAYDKIEEVLRNASHGEKQICMEQLSALPKTGSGRVVTTGGHYAYLKIAEGCDKHCTYCAIPSLRGTYRSVPMEELLEEAKELAEKGVRELILVAQETTVYGKDIYGEKRLHCLLEELCRIEGIQWIRVLYCYPEEIYEELIQTMKKEEKICHYLDLPIQHADDTILKKMGRKTNRAELTALIEHLREEIPDIILRTTLIAGFPGETEEQHEAAMEFIDEMEFDRLGVFAYSQEDGTPAGRMPDQIPDEVKEERRDRLMELQQEIAFDLANERVGQEMWVMVEGQVSGENAYVARTYGDAPEVDGYLFIQTTEQLMSGDFAKVRVTGAVDYDLIGELL